VVKNRPDKKKKKGRGEMIGLGEKKNSPLAPKRGGKKARKKE